MSNIQGCSIQTDCYCSLGNGVLFKTKNEMFLFLSNLHCSWKAFRSFNIVNIEKYVEYLNKESQIMDLIRTPRDLVEEPLSAMFLIFFY